MNRSKQAGMAKKAVGALLVGLALTLVHLVEAQQPAKVPQIGYVAANEDPNIPGPNVEAFRQGLRDLGYTEGKNIFVEYRYAEGELDRVPSLVAELVQLKVDVLVSGNFATIRAAKQATKTIPIVIVTC
jgi:putative ABC transport system substrate-binding protein